ncbi:MAG: VWA domain-containing protein, partial [Planctomycetes bacterium]|nr:VWA domain-containing protein [Planctomycetota bacterium]
MSWSRSVVILFIALVALLPRAADAAGVLVPQDGSAPIRVRSHRVTAVIEDGIARTTVRQTFVSPYGRALEAVYVFPIPEGAALVDLAMETGGQRLEGLLAERRTARRAYDRIVRMKLDPAIVEQIGRSTFRLSVFPVLPDQPTVVEITWIQAAPVQRGEIRYVYPLALDGEPAVTDQDFTFSATVRSSASIKSVASPDLGVAARLVSDHEANASMERTSATLGRDLTVVAKVVAEEATLAVKTFRGAKGDPFFSAVVTPPNVAEDRILPRDITLVLDTSGSMEGEKLEQAKTSALWLLDNLRPRDRVNLIRFASLVDRASDAPIEATPENLTKLRAFVAEAKAEGGTALGDALSTACEAPVSPERVPMVVFLTDGEPTVGEQSPGVIVEFARVASDRGLRVFTFGVGSDVNASLLEGIATAGRGTSESFRPQGEVASRLRSFLTRTGSPVISRVRVEIDGHPALGVFPRPLADIYLGEQAVITGRVAAEGVHEFVVKGFLDGREIALSAKADFSAAVGGTSAVRDLWAKSHLDFLERSLRLRSKLPDAAYYAALDRGAYATSDELVQAMISVSLETGVQCAYTSFLALLPEDRARLDPRDNAAIGEALERASAKRRELAGLTRREPPKTAATPLPAAPSAPDTGTALGADEPPPAPEETKPLEESERVTEDPFLKDAKVADHNETDTDTTIEESLGDPRFSSDAPFEGPGAGGTIGIGGGAGGRFGGRSSGGRVLRAGGGGRMAKTPVGLALDWMATQQAVDGRWTSGAVAPAADAPSDVAATGLALLSYLGAGDTHQSGEHKQQVKEGAKYLRNVQDTAGCFGPQTTPSWRRDHLIATLAMVEAYGMTQSVIFKDAAQRGVTFALTLRRDDRGAVVAARTPAEVEEAAWLILVTRSAVQAELDVGARPWEDVKSLLSAVPFDSAPPPAADAALRAVARTLATLWSVETPGDAEHAAA